jgi:glycolate oxidase
MKQLFSFLSDGQVVVDFEEREAFATDKSPGLRATPDAVLYPETEAQVGQILTAAYANGIVIVPRGAGTGTTGGAVSIHGGVQLSFERMNRILDIDTDNRMAVVEPGVITAKLQEAVEAVGLFYPPDPASLDSCTLGGNVAENAGGPRCLKYGVTGHYVTGLSGYYADGTPFRFGGKLYKNVAGLDLMRLLVGSEGTLAVITTITLRLLPKPKAWEDAMAVYDSIDDAIASLQAVLQSGVQPAVAEFMDAACVQAVSSLLGHHLPPGEAYVLFQCDGDAESVQRDMQTIKGICQSHRMSLWVSASEEAARKMIWLVRRHVSDALKYVSPFKFSQDISVPPAAIGAYMRFLRELGQTHGLRVLGYGHLGDGNIHVNVLRMDTAPDIWEAKKPIVTAAIFVEALRLGGTLSGEHGIGVTKKAYMPLMFSVADLAIMRGVKAVFDPKGLLNPGKIFE